MRIKWKMVIRCYFPLLVCERTQYYYSQGGVRFSTANATLTISSRTLKIGIRVVAEIQVKKEREKLRPRQ